jgi:DNA repair ATPase RecN
MDNQKIEAAINEVLGLQRRYSNEVLPHLKESEKQAKETNNKLNDIKNDIQGLKNKDEDVTKELKTISNKLQDLKDDKNLDKNLEIPKEENKKSFWDKIWGK